MHSPPFSQPFSAWNIRSGALGDLSFSENQRLQVEIRATPFSSANYRSRFPGTWVKAAGLPPTPATVHSGFLETLPPSRKYRDQPWRGRRLYHRNSSLATQMSQLNRTYTPLQAPGSPRKRTVGTDVALELDYLRGNPHSNHLLPV